MRHYTHVGFGEDYPTEQRPYQCLVSVNTPAAIAAAERHAQEATGLSLAQLVDTYALEGPAFLSGRLPLAKVNAISDQLDKVLKNSLCNIDAIAMREQHADELREGGQMMAAMEAVKSPASPAAAQAAIAELQAKLIKPVGPPPAGIVAKQAGVGVGLAMLAIAGVYLLMR